MAPKENKKPEGLRDALKEVAKGNVNQPVRGGITEPGQQGLGILPVGQQQAEKPAGGGLDKHTKYGPEDPAGAATDAAKAGSGAVSNKLGEGGIPNLQDGVKPLAGGMAAIADRKRAKVIAEQLKRGGEKGIEDELGYLKDDAFIGKGPPPPDAPNEE